VLPLLIRILWGIARNEEKKAPVRKGFNFMFFPTSKGFKQRIKPISKQ
jgi:hypothetical protein